MSIINTIGDTLGNVADTLRGQQPTPEYKVTVDGNDISPLINRRLISLTITDNAGFEADTLDLALVDHDGLLDLPRRGAVIRVLLGWQGDKIYDKGSYTVDEIEHSGAPDTLTIRAKSADMRAELQRRKEISWHRQTVGSIVRSIAAAQKLAPFISERLEGIAVEHLDQQMESDAAFLTRLATIYGALATIKDGKLLFISRGDGTSARGIVLPETQVTRLSGDSHRFSIADRGAYTGVIAHWYSARRANRQSVEVKRSKEAKPPKRKRKAPKPLTAEELEAAERAKVIRDDVLVGSEDNVKILRHLYATEHNAKQAALAEWERLQRGVAGFSISLAYGRPDIYPECPITVSGYKPAIDAATWVGRRVTHTLDSSGLRTQVELEVMLDELPG